MTVTPLDLFLFQLGAVCVGLALGAALPKSPPIKHWYLFPALMICLVMQTTFFDLLRQNPVTWFGVIKDGQYALAWVIMLLTRRWWMKLPGEE